MVSEILFLDLGKFVDFLKGFTNVRVTVIYYEEILAFWKSDLIELSSSSLIS